MSTPAETPSSTTGAASGGGGSGSGSATARTQASFHVSKRAPKACSNCHRRKVRCDAHMHPEGTPCSYCKSTGHDCVLLPGRRGSTYQKTKKRLAAAAAAAAVAAGQLPATAEELPSPTTTTSQSGPPPAPALDPRKNPYSAIPLDGITASHSVLSPTKQEMLTSPNSPASNHGNDDPAMNPSLSDEHVWVQFLDKVHDQGRGTNLLEQQFAAQHTPSNYLQPENSQQTRENSTDPHGDVKRRVLIYNGETMLDGAVPTLAGLHQVRDGSAVLDPSFAFPDAAIYGPPEGWTTYANVKHIYDSKIILEDDKRYLIEHKRVHVFPPPEVCDRLIKSFFKHVYPNLPILDRPSFIRGYRRMMFQDHVYSLLLMHAVFYASTYHASSSLISACGFPNRLAARAYFFSRAKLLHAMDAEKEHLFIIQACILLTMWWTRYEEEKETRFFMTAAVLLGQRMGMHRTIRGGWGLGQSERRLWKRIWWTLYVRSQLNVTTQFGDSAKVLNNMMQNRDHISASSLGKPAMIRSSDLDVKELTEDDFVENWGDIEEEDARQFCPPQSIVNIKYSLELVKLAKLYERIHSIQYCIQRRPTQEELDSIAADIGNWKTQLPHELSTSRYDELRTWTPENFWPILLQLVHDRAVSLHYRPRCAPPKKGIYGQGESPEGADIKEREKARKAVVASANSTFRLVEDLLRHDLLRYCPPIIQTPLFIAMIIYAEEIKLSPESSSRFNLATNKINLGMMALGELRKIWAASSWAYRMFEYIIDRKFAPISTPDITGVDPTAIGEVPMEGLDKVYDDDITAVTDPALLQDSASMLAAAAINAAAAAAAAAAANANANVNVPTITTEEAPTATSHSSPPSSAPQIQGPPLPSGHCMWNVGTDSPPPTHSSVHTPGATASVQGDAGGAMDATDADCVPAGESDAPFDFDLTWMAMSGLAGDMPFHFEGAQPGVKGGPQGNGVQAAAARGGNDLWSLLGMGEGAL